MRDDLVQVTVLQPCGDLTRPRDPAQEAIIRLRHALLTYHTPNVPHESDPDAVVEVAIRRLSELYLVATKGP